MRVDSRELHVKDKSAGNNERSKNYSGLHFFICLCKEALGRVSKDNALDIVIIIIKTF